jgi:hypothetical protein
MKNNIELNFESKKNFVVPEILMRILMFTIMVLNINSITRQELMEHHIYDFFWIGLVVNVFILLLTIFFNSRRFERLKRIIEIRTKNVNAYQESDFTYINNGNSTEFTFLISIQTITFFLSVVLIPFFITIRLHKDPDSLYIFFGFLFSVLYFLTLFFCKKIFISSKIEKIKINGIELSKEEFINFKNLFLFETTKNTLYLNDELIVNVTNTANDYKQRVETLLIESVFIGALTFGTFIQLTSPESISSISQIEEKENISSGIMDVADFKVKNLRTELKSNNEIWQPVKVSSNLLSNKIIIPINKQSRNGGYFTNWALDRKLTIFSFYYNDVSDEEKYKLLTGHFESKSVFLNDEKDSLKTNIESLLKDSLTTMNKINQLSSLSARLILITKINSVFTITNLKQINEVRGLIVRINPNQISKYESIMKSSWDEQEYIFLIAIGSIICSVFYIAVLIKRYPIVISIEKLIAEINKAKIWNDREESMQNRKLETEMMHMPDDFIDTYDKKIDYFSERLQNQLAICESVASKIETNIKIVSIFRSIGLGLFFIVLLISTQMIDSSVSLFLFVIITYAIFIAEILNDNSFIIRVWRLVFKKQESDNIILK